MEDKKVSGCPTCGRRPSERNAMVWRFGEQLEESCPDPIHDAADRYAEHGEAMEATLRKVHKMVEQLILETPTSKARDALTDINITVLLGISGRKPND